jgi:hypothetical protein
LAVDADDATHAAYDRRTRLFGGRCNVALARVSTIDAREQQWTIVNCLAEIEVPLEIMAPVGSCCPFRYVDVARGLDVFVCCAPIDMLIVALR